MYFKSLFESVGRIISSVSFFQMETSEDDINAEEYPTEIHDYLTTFEKSLSSVDEMLKTMMSVPRSELLYKVNHLPFDSLSVIKTGVVWNLN